jgi:GAF domain-containing protein
LGRAVCAVPIKIQREVIGMLMLVRKEARPFGDLEQTLLEAIANYASISLVNARLFRALNNSAQTSGEGEKHQNALLEAIRSSIADELKSAVYPLDLLLNGKAGHLTDIQQQALRSTRAALQRLARTLEKTTPSVPVTLKKK